MTLISRRTQLEIVELKDGCVTGVEKPYRQTHFSAGQPGVVRLADELIVAEEEKR